MFKLRKPQKTRWQNCRGKFFPIFGEKTRFWKFGGTLKWRTFSDLCLLEEEPTRSLQATFWRGAPREPSQPLESWGSPFTAGWGHPSLGAQRRAGRCVFLGSFSTGLPVDSSHAGRLPAPPPAPRLGRGLVARGQLRSSAQSERKRPTRWKAKGACRVYNVCDHSDPLLCVGEARREIKRRSQVRSWTDGCEEKSERKKYGKQWMRTGVRWDRLG